MIVEIKTGDLLNADESYIAHQTCCVSNKSKGLSKLVFKKFPFANVYIDRYKTLKADEIGTISIMKKREGGDKTIINMFAQFYPGNTKNLYRWKKAYINRFGEVEIKSKNDGDLNETIESRLNAFGACVEEIDDCEFDRVAIPCGIGCGLAGGNWDDYLKILEKAKTKFVIYKLY